MTSHQVLEDARLFSLAREGDRNAFAALIERHKDALVTYLARLTGSRDDAEDLAQETFLRMLERSGAYSEQGKLQAYIYRIATNLARSRARQTRRRRILGAIFLSPNGHRGRATQQEELLSQELRKQLSRALARIPLHYRVPIVLSDVEGWSHQEIAGLLRCRPGTVKSRIHRGRRLLRQELAPYRTGG